MSYISLLVVIAVLTLFVVGVWFVGRRWGDLAFPPVTGAIAGIALLAIFGSMALGLPLFLSLALTLFVVGVWFIGNRWGAAPVLAIAALVGLAVLSMFVSYKRVQSDRPAAAHVETWIPLDHHAATEASRSTSPEPAGLVIDRRSMTSKMVVPPEQLPRPKWVDEKPQLSGDDYRTAIVAGPYATIEECEEAAFQKVAEEFRRVATSYLGDDAGETIDLPDDTMLLQVQQDRWIEKTNSPTVGPMLTAHVLLVFDAPVRDHVQQLARQSRIESRLWTTGGIAIAVLGLLAATFGWLKLSGPKKDPYAVGT